MVKSVRLIVGKPGVDSLVESDQKALKVGIHSFNAWRTAFKRDGVEIKPASSLIASLGKALNGGIASTFERLDW